jgi:hypothetical protein
MTQANSGNTEGGSGGGKKPFHELSVAAKFHTAPKMFGENVEAPFIDTEVDEIRGIVSARQEHVLGKPHGKKLSTQEGINLRNVIQSALNAELSEEARNDEIEQQKLFRCKNKIREMLGDVLSTIEQYISSVLTLSIASRSGIPAQIKDADTNRKIKHDKLMESINVLNRSLLWWFGDFSPYDLPDAQQQMYEKQQERYICRGIKRVRIPENGIYPPSLNPKDRNQITHWAKSIYRDLITIESLDGLINLG